MSSGKWSVLLQQWSKDLQLWLYITATLQLFRLFLIATYHQQAGAHSGASTVLAVLATGLRYDISTAGLWITPTVLLSLVCVPLGRLPLLKTLRTLSAQLYVIAGSLIFTIDLVFFGVFGDQLNQMIFGIYFDDTRAIAATIWKTYHPLWFLAAAISAMLIHLWLIKRWLAYDIRAIPRFARSITHHQVMAVVIVLLSVTLSIRGGKLWGEPIQLKHAFVVNDLFLNRTVVNPFSALHYSIDTELKLAGAAAFPSLWSGNELHAALETVCQMRKEPACSGNLDQALSVAAHGHASAKPRHIFLMLMESHSGWTIMPYFRNAGLSPEFSALADKGIYFPNMVSAGSGTINAVNTLITGMPDLDMNINYLPASRHPYPSSLAVIMKRLGYKTRFFYGGFLSWQRLDLYAHDQGFDEVYGGGDMNEGDGGNEWGVNDKALFDHVLKAVDDATPSFNFILTTSNHPPWDLDLEALGFPIKTLPKPLEITKTDTIRIMGHLWYADQQAGRFVHAANAKLHQPLFAITGDHTAREQVKFPDDNVMEQVAVPFILYGPQVLQRAGVIDPTAGAHLDIPATLIELAADKGFAYTAYGTSLLHKQSPSYGYGWQYIIGENGIANVSDPSNVYGLAMQPHPNTKIDLRLQLKEFEALKTLSRYRVIRSAELPATGSSVAASR